MKIARPKASREHGAEGFSLIEMLVVLTVVAAVTSLAFPLFHALTKPTPLKIARDIVQLTQIARLSALRTGVAQDLIIDGVANEIRLASGERRIHIPRHIPFKATVGRDESLISEVGVISFQPDGSSTGGTIDFGTADGSQASLSVNWVTGAVNLKNMPGP